MKLVPIPDSEYDNYRLDVIFNCYKWDPQFMDHKTIARHVLVITEEEHAELTKLTEKLHLETIQAEEYLNLNLNLVKPLAFPARLRRVLRNMESYDSGKHIRLTRFDFHPTSEGSWAISEVNSDVPGGFAEASLMPGVAADLLGCDTYWYVNFGDILAKALSGKIKPEGKIMFVHCTSFSDDRQVMQFLGDKLSALGFHAIYAAADHVRFDNRTAVSILDGNRGSIDALFRFTPVEWLINMKLKYWQGYFDTTTLSCNHPIALYAQTKRFPLVWETLEARGIHLPAWRQLLPETLDVRDVKHERGFIYKPAYGRTGENISIEEACREDEYKRILTDVKNHPDRYLAQKRFNSLEINSENGDRSSDAYHVCLGSFCVEGKAAGYYARISRTPRIDSAAADIPVLIERKPS
jgi:glutathionylspermidine synthase